MDWGAVEDRDRYPFSVTAVRHLERLRLHPNLTIFVGENGSGKSTLIEALAIKAGFNAEGGSQNMRFQTRATESELHRALILERSPERWPTGFFVRAESFFNLASEVVDQGLGAYGWEDLHQKSHGEAFLWLVQHRFGEYGLFILDEPEAALSPQRQLALLAELHRMVLGGCQIVMATHSPILMACPGALIYQLDEDGVREVALDETEHWTVTRTFMESPERMLRLLLADRDTHAPDEDD